MLGDILESFGIAKDRIKKPIAELMGITDSEKPAQLDQAKTDQSGIVEDKQDNPTPEGQKRNEVITLISEYLASTSNQTLANVFGIFSEIEQDPVMADKIIQYVNTLKTTNHANV
jgi:23S rRNA maturation-related 3'-5' exoribonuclease YhaM